MPPLIGVAIEAALVAVVGDVAATGAILGTGLTVTGIVSNALFFGGLFGAELLLNHPRSAQPSFKAPPGPVSFEPGIQPISARFYTFGRDRLGGVYIFRESDGLTLGFGLVLNCGPIDAVEAFYIDDELPAYSTGACSQATGNVIGTYSVMTVNFGPDIIWPSSGIKVATFYTYVWTPTGPTPVVTGTGPAGFLEFRNATFAGHASFLLQHFFSSLWTADHKARDLAVLYSTWRQFASANRLSMFPRLWPVHSTVLRGAKVFDPRDGTQSFLDPDSGVFSLYNPTWKWSANAALGVAFYLVHPHGFGKTYDDIDWPSFITAANDCDRVCDKYDGGVEAFAQAHITWSAEEERRDVLNRFLAACDGMVYETPDGKIALWIGKWENPTVVLTAADISALEFEQVNSVFSEANVISTTYVEPRTNFTKNTSLTWRDEDSIARVGERKATLDFSGVHSFDQAYRLAARAGKRRNTPLRGTIAGGPRLLLCEGKRVIEIDAPEYGVSGVFRIMSPLRGDDLGHVSFQISKVTSNMYADEVAPFDPVNPSMPGVALLAPFVPIAPKFSTVTDAVVAGSGYVTATVYSPPTTPGGDGSAPYLDTASTARFRWREVDPGTHAPLSGGAGAWVIWDISLGQYSAESPTVTGATGTTRCFEIEAWLVSPLGQPGNYSASNFQTLTF